jgi:outer membrane protein TolC
MRIFFSLFLSAPAIGLTVAAGSGRSGQGSPDPVFDAGRIRANIEIRNAQQEQALTQFEKSVLTALGDVETALVNYANEQVRYRSLTDPVARQ